MGCGLGGGPRRGRGALSGCSRFPRLERPPRGGAVWYLVGLITRRSQVRILPPLSKKAPQTRGFLMGTMGRLGEQRSRVKLRVKVLHGLRGQAGPYVRPVRQLCLARDGGAGLSLGPRLRCRESLSPEGGAGGDPRRGDTVGWWSPSSPRI